MHPHECAVEMVASLNMVNRSLAGGRGLKRENSLKKIKAFIGVAAIGERSGNRPGKTEKANRQINRSRYSLLHGSGLRFNG